MVATVTRTQAQHADKTSNTEAPQDMHNGDHRQCTGHARGFSRHQALAQTCTVLINGESVPVSWCARTAPRSPGANNAFVALNMAAIPQELMESELFGPRKARSRCQQSSGRPVRAGRGGTLFLDEIGDMPAATQTRLLRVLQDGEFFRVGGVDSIKADVRIIAATHQKLESLVESGAFREDLFHRLNVIRIHVPKLSERREDIPQLLTHFLTAAGKELGVEAKVLSADALDLLTQLPWPACPTVGKYLSVANGHGRREGGATVRFAARTPSRPKRPGNWTSGQLARTTLWLGRPAAL